MKKQLNQIIFVSIMLICLVSLMKAQTYKIVGTGQTKHYNNTGEITAPAKGEAYYGQAACYPGNIPSYTDNGDGTITDNVTDLMWVKDRGSLISWSNAIEGASTNRTAGYSDWRMPTIKELYSLIQFSGVNGPDNTVVTGFIPFINTTYFGFAYGVGGSSSTGERIIDCQDWSANKYVSTVMGNQPAIFGVNFADGRIKGYNELIPNTGAKNTKYVRYVRGNPSYGKNNFKDNVDNTVTDLATNLMWSKDDSKIGLDWQEALAWVQAQNAKNYLGHNDWRLPDSKELESIVDYTRSPSTTNSPAIDVTFFNSTSITNEAGQIDYPYVWTSSVLIDGGPNPSGIYISFGRAMGYMSVFGGWVDVHGAGTQKSDLMVGNPANYPNGRGPQGDAIRIYNYVRLVRTDNTATSIEENQTSVNSVPDAFYLFQNYPNPFNPTTQIIINIPQSGDYALTVFNVLGQKVATLLNNRISNGTYTFNFDASNLPSGIYLYNLRGNNFNQTKKMLFMK